MSGWSPTAVEGSGHRPRDVGHWQRRVLEADSVVEVETVLRHALQSLLRRRVHVDLAGGRTDILGAKEVAAALSELSGEFPQAALDGIVFRHFTSYARGVRAETNAGSNGVSIAFNLAYYGADARRDLALALMHGRHNGQHHYDVRMLGAVDAIHEFGHVLDYTLDYRIGYRHGGRSRPPHQWWTRANALPGFPHSLRQELTMVAGLSCGRLLAARRADPRNPVRPGLHAERSRHDSADFRHDERHWGLSYWAIKDKVSRYALRNTFELVAESFTRVIVDRDAADPVSVAVHRRLMAALGRTSPPQASRIAACVAHLHSRLSPERLLGLDGDPEFADFLTAQWASR